MNQDESSLRITVQFISTLGLLIPHQHTFYTKHNICTK